MEKAFVKAEDLAGHIKDYINNRVDSVKLNVAEKTSKLGANLIAFVIVSVFALFFVVFASIALAYVFSALTGKLYWGFLMVAGFYLLAGVIIWSARERLLRLPVMNALLQQLFTEEKEEDEED
jgi:hypothetical protein